MMYGKLEKCLTLGFDFGNNMELRHKKLCIRWNLSMVLYVQWYKKLSAAKYIFLRYFIGRPDIVDSIFENSKFKGLREIVKLLIITKWMNFSYFQH